MDSSYRYFRLGLPRKGMKTGFLSQSSGEYKILSHKDIESKNLENFSYIRKDPEESDRWILEEKVEKDFFSGFYVFKGDGSILLPHIFREYLKEGRFYAVMPSNQHIHQWKDYLGFYWKDKYCSICGKIDQKSRVPIIGFSSDR